MTKQFKFSRRRVILKKKKKKKSKRPLYDGAAEKNVTGVITTGHIITGEHDISTRVKETPISPPSPALTELFGRHHSPNCLSRSTNLVCRNGPIIGGAHARFYSFITSASPLFVIAFID